jgi:RNA polymerase sigma-70 factor (ECF subfamily)
MVHAASRSPVGESEKGAVVHPVAAGRDVSDTDLVQRARQGNRWAEEMLYRRHATFLLGICTRLLREMSDAEDVVQDAYIDAFEQLPNLRHPHLFRRWLTGIAVHKVHRRLRRRRLLRILGLADSQQEHSLESCLAGGASPEVYADIVCLDHSLRKLADAPRVAWQLRYIEGYRLEEVADLCQCSLATAKRRIAEAEQTVHRFVHIEEVSDG